MNNLGYKSNFVFDIHSTSSNSSKLIIKQHSYIFFFKVLGAHAQCGRRYQRYQMVRIANSWINYFNNES